MRRISQKDLNKLLGRSPSKYRNIPTTCLSKHRHDSRAEADYCNYLLASVQQGKITGYEIQKPFELAPGIVHVVDFLVCLRGDAMFGGVIEEVHEVKGTETKEWCIKYKLFRQKYPHIKYVLIKKGERVNVDGKKQGSKRTGAKRDAAWEREHGISRRDKKDLS